MLNGILLMHSDIYCLDNPKKSDSLIKEFASGFG